MGTLLGDTVIKRSCTTVRNSNIFLENGRPRTEIHPADLPTNTLVTKNKLRQKKTGTWSKTGQHTFDFVTDGRFCVLRYHRTQGIS
jgi:hypothetical protein